MNRNRSYNPQNDLESKIKKADRLIEELEELKTEWELRIKEANAAKETYETMTSLLRKQLNL